MMMKSRQQFKNSPYKIESNHINLNPKAEEREKKAVKQLEDQFVKIMKLVFAPRSKKWIR